MVTLPGLTKGITKDADPPDTDTQISPQSVPDGTVLITTKVHNDIVDILDVIIDILSGDFTFNGDQVRIPQLAIDGLVEALAAKQDSLNFTPENIANKNEHDGYAGLDETGKISDSAIPNLSAEKITSGTFSILRIPNITVAKIRNFVESVKAIRLDQLAAPTKNVLFNGKEIINTLSVQFGNNVNDVIGLIAGDQMTYRSRNSHVFEIGTASGNVSFEVHPDRIYAQKPMHYTQTEKPNSEAGAVITYSKMINDKMQLYYLDSDGVEVGPLVGKSKQSSIVKTTNTDITTDIQSIGPIELLLTGNSIMINSDDYEISGNGIKCKFTGKIKVTAIVSNRRNNNVNGSRATGRIQCAINDTIQPVAINWFNRLMISVGQEATVAGATLVDILDVVNNDVISIYNTAIEGANRNIILDRVGGSMLLIERLFE